MPAPIIIAAAIAGAVSLIGAAIEAGQRGEAQRLRQEIADKYGNEAVAQLDQALVTEIPHSALAGVVEDRTLREAQLNTMNELRNVYDQEGMTGSDVAALRLVQQDAAQSAAQNQAGVEAMLARRGQAGGALSAVMAAQGGQTAANAVGRAGMQMHADARMRALRALEASGEMAGDIRSADWRSSSAKAAAQDQLNQYNNEHKFKVHAYNQGLKQQDYDNRMQRLIAQGNAKQGLAAGYDAAGARAAEGFGALGQGAVKTGQLIQYYDDEEKKKGAR